MSERLDRIERILENLAIKQDKLAESQVKNEKENEKFRLETKNNLDKLAVSQAKTEKEIRITTKSFRKVSKMFGGSERNKGLIFEDIFYNSFLKSKTLNNIKYDHVVKNLELEIGKEKKGEIDIVLLNGSHIALIEIKSIANINDFKQIDKYLESYKKIYPYEKRKIFIYYGSTCFTKEIKQLAELKGYGLLSLKGEIIRLETENIKEFSL